MEYSYRDELYHHGIKGQKWGVRRFQNSDRTWTAAGKARYGDGGTSSNSRPVSGGGSRPSANKMGTTQKGKIDSDKLKKAAKIGAAVAGTALVAYGAYKLNDLAIKDLKAGDRYLANNKELMLSTHLDNYVKQMGEYYKAKGPTPITNRTSPELRTKLDRMQKSADAAARRYIETSKEVTRLRARADSGNYTTKEKLEALKRMARR